MPLPDDSYAVYEVYSMYRADFHSMVFNRFKTRYAVKPFFESLFF